MGCLSLPGYYTIHFRIGDFYAVFRTNDKVATYFFLGILAAILIDSITSYRGREFKVFLLKSLF